MTIEQLQEILRNRFQGHLERHPGLSVEAVFSTLQAEDWQVLLHMEGTGGAPDVIEKEDGTWFFADCYEKVPDVRASLCYDEQALQARKKNPPRGSALGMVADIGSQLLNEDDYHILQSRMTCDEKISSWLWTPQEVRQHGGALFGDSRYGRVFIYHNGADAYYRARGFRTGYVPVAFRTVKQ